MTSDKVGSKGQDKPPEPSFPRHAVVLETPGTARPHFQPVNQNHKPSMSQASSHILLPLNKIMKVKMKNLEDFWFFSGPAVTHIEGETSPELAPKHLHVHSLSHCEVPQIHWEFSFYYINR